MTLLERVRAYNKTRAMETTALANIRELASVFPETLFALLPARLKKILEDYRNA